MAKKCPGENFEKKIKKIIFYFIFNFLLKNSKKKFKKFLNRFWLDQTGLGSQEPQKYFILIDKTDKKQGVDKVSSRYKKIDHTGKKYQNRYKWQKLGGRYSGQQI